MFYKIVLLTEKTVRPDFAEATEDPGWLSIAGALKAGRCPGSEDTGMLAAVTSYEKARWNRAKAESPRGNWKYEIIPSFD